jgi:hypothetical protein
MPQSPLSPLSVYRQETAAPAQPSHAPKINLSNFLRSEGQPTLKQQANKVAAAGRNGDDTTIHVNSRTELPLIKDILPAFTRNPSTGNLEFWASSDGNHMQGGGGSPGGSSGGSSRTGNNGDGGSRGPISPGAALHGAGGNNIASGGSPKPGDTPGGGTYTSYDYSPGATPNFPDANTAAVVDNVFTSAVPVAGAVNTAVKAANTISSGDLSKPANGLVGSVFGADPGPQRGWAPDRNHGVPNAVGGANNGGVQAFSPLGALRYVPIQDPDSYNALLSSLKNPKTYSSSDAVIVR